MYLFTFMSRIWNKCWFSSRFRIWQFKIKETKKNLWDRLKKSYPNLSIWIIFSYRPNQFFWRTPKYIFQTESQTPNYRARPPPRIFNYRVPLWGFDALIYRGYLLWYANTVCDFGRILVCRSGMKFLQKQKIKCVIYARESLVDHWCIKFFFMESSNFPPGLALHATVG